MLYNPEDNKNNSSDNNDRLIHADSDNERITDDVKANENSLFGKKAENRPDHGHDSLFDSSFNDDDLVSSSFAISFKANDPNSVSDMLKEEQNTQSLTQDLTFDDDLADFEFDSSVSAFKPINSDAAPAHVDNKKTEKIPEPKPVAKPEESKPEDPFEGIDDVTPPKFTDDDKDFLELAGMSESKDDELFKSGDDLDFATSSKDKAESPFANAQKPEEPKASDIDIPSSHEVEDVDNAKIESFGKVESGVNAFKKKTPEPAKEAPKQNENVAAAAAAAAAEVASSAQPEVKAAPAGAPRSSTPTSPTTRPAARPLAQPQPIKSNIDDEKTSKVRPGTSDASMQTRTERSNKSSTKIAPVSQVSTKKKRKDPKSKKDPGKGGLITLAVVIVVFLGIFLILDNADKITAAFNGNQPVTTVVTSSSSSFSEATTKEPTSEATTSATTTATSATTTEATTTATTTEATTTTTTEEPTTTTTEATTTTTTTAATTAQTTSGSSTGVRVKNLSTSVKHFKSTSNGFSFDVVITNKTKKDASLSASLNYFRIKLYANKTIKNLTSSGFTFSRSGNTFTCKPIDRTIPAGKTVTIKVTVTTSGKPAHFGYNTVFFKMK